MLFETARDNSLVRWEIMRRAPDLEGHDFQAVFTGIAMVRDGEISYGPGLGEWIWASWRNCRQTGLIVPADKGYQGSTYAKTPYKGKNEPQSPEKTQTAPARNYAHLASARMPSSRPGRSSRNSAAAPGKPGSSPRPSTHCRSARHNQPGWKEFREAELPRLLTQCVHRSNPPETITVPCWIPLAASTPNPARVDPLSEISVSCQYSHDLAIDSSGNTRLLS